jgi:hypothetical protein
MLEHHFSYATTASFQILYSSVQSQSHIATDGQSASMSWCRAQSGTFNQRFFFFESFSLVIFGAPSLMRGRVCHVSVFVIVVYSCQSIFTTNIYIKLKIYMCYKHLQYSTIHIYNIYRPRSVQALCSRLCPTY